MPDVLCTPQPYFAVLCCVAQRARLQFLPGVAAEASCLPSVLPWNQQYVLDTMGDTFKEAFPQTTFLEVRMPKLPAVIRVHVQHTHPQMLVLSVHWHRIT